MAMLARAALFAATSLLPLLLRVARVFLPPTYTPGPATPPSSLYS